MLNTKYHTAEIEEKTINELMNQCKTNMKIIIYGQNASDENVNHKYKQLTELGFQEVIFIAADYLNGYYYKIYTVSTYYYQSTRFLFYKPRPLFHIPRLK